MKIGIQTSTFDTEGYGRWKDKTYDKLNEHGYSCTDFDMSNTETPIYTLPEEEAKELLLKEKELAEKSGIEIVQVHGPWRWPPKDLTQEDRAERMEKMKKSIRLTSHIGCKNWIVHPVMPYGIEEAGTEDAEKTWNINIEFMTELLKTAKEYDVTICLENMPMINFSLAKPEDILRFVKTINDDNFKICLDTGHVSVFFISVGDEVRRLGSEIKALHVHDNSFGVDLHSIPYFGIIDWDDFAKALKEINFEGCLSLETMPPRRLEDDMFEDMCHNMFTLAEKISEKTGL